MKKTIAITFMAVTLAGSIFASGAQDDVSVTELHRAVEEGAVSSVAQVFPSSDILGVFTDNDDDGLYSSALPFLTGEGDRHDLTQSVSDYISEIVSNDTDDVMDLIRGELKAELNLIDNEQTYMILGNYRIVADVQKTEGEPARITYEREIIDFTPVKSVQIEASDDVLAVLYDNDDDGVFSGLVDRNVMTKSSADYISDVVFEDTDDISEIIFDELKSVLENGVVEKSEMILGNHKFSATLEASNNYKMVSEKVDYAPELVAVVAASDDVLGIFSDNDDDGLYDSALPYLTGEMDASTIPVDVNDYIATVIFNDSDDLREVIYGDLSAAFEEGEVEQVTMKLGSYVFSLSLEYIS